MAYNILVVDDSSVIRSVVKKTIAMTELEVRAIHEAGNGREALQVLKDHWIDIVFADLNMPEMDGVELVNRMASDNLLEKIPVVIISSERNQAKIAALKERGIRAYIKKPFRPESFKAAVDDALGISRGGQR